MFALCRRCRLVGEDLKNALVQQAVSQALRDHYCRNPVTCAPLHPLQVSPRTPTASLENAHRLLDEPAVEPLQSYDLVTTISVPQVAGIDELNRLLIAILDRPGSVVEIERVARSHCCNHPIEVGMRVSPGLLRSRNNTSSL